MSPCREDAWLVLAGEQGGINAVGAGAGDQPEVSALTRQSDRSLGRRCHRDARCARAAPGLSAELGELGGGKRLRPRQRDPPGSRWTPGDAEFVVEVRTRRQAGHADEADRLPLANAAALAKTGREAAEMRIKRGDAAPVIEHDRLSRNPLGRRCSRHGRRRPHAPECQSVRRSPRRDARASSPGSDACERG